MKEEYAANVLEVIVFISAENELLFSLCNILKQKKKCMQ